MTRHDPMDVLTGPSTLDTLKGAALVAAAWFHAVTEWESTWRAPFTIKAPASPHAPIIVV